MSSFVKGQMKSRRVGTGGGVAAAWLLLETSMVVLIIGITSRETEREREREFQNDFVRVCIKAKKKINYEFDDLPAKLLRQKSSNTGTTVL